MSKKKNKKIPTLAERIIGMSNEEQYLYLLNRPIAELIKAFEVEKRAKNQAYIFIGKIGESERFMEYCTKRQKDG